MLSLYPAAISVRGFSNIKPILQHVPYSISTEEVCASIAGGSISARVEKYCYLAVTFVNCFLEALKKISKVNSMIHSLKKGGMYPP